MGEEHVVEVAGEEDEGVEAILHSLRYHMRRRSWSHRLRRHAVHQQTEPWARSSSSPDRSPRFSRTHAFSSLWIISIHLLACWVVVLFIIWYGKFLDFYVFVGLWHWFLMGLDWAGFSDFVWRLRFNVNFISCQTYPKCELYFLQNRTCFKF